MSMIDHYEDEYDAVCGECVRCCDPVIEGDDVMTVAGLMHVGCAEAEYGE